MDILIATYDDDPAVDNMDPATATYRAIENGFSLIRPAGHGLSMVTDPEGRLLGSLDYFMPSSGILLSRIPTHGMGTIYRLIGDPFAYLCVAGLILLAIYSRLFQKHSTRVSQNQLAMS